MSDVAFSSPRLTGCFSTSIVVVQATTVPVSAAATNLPIVLAYFQADSANVGDLVLGQLTTLGVDPLAGIRLIPGAVSPAFYGMFLQQIAVRNLSAVQANSLRIVYFT